MSDEIQAYVSWFIIVAVGGGILLRLVTAPYLIWKEDRARIADLETRLAAPKQREREKLADHLVEQKIKVADEVTRIRRVISDKETTSVEKKRAFRGSEMHVDKLFFDPVVEELWQSFHEAANGAYRRWQTREKSKNGNAVGFAEEVQFGHACLAMDERARAVIDYLLYDKMPEPSSDVSQPDLDPLRIAKETLP